MKMNLKNKKKINLNLFTKKNYLIFLISFFIVSIIVGIIFYLYLNTNDKIKITDNLNNYFSINTNYLISFFNSLKSNLFNTLIIWILGISIIGSLYNLNLYFLEGFSVGFTIMSIFDAYKFKGLLGTFSYIIPSKLIYIFLLFILTYFSLKFSYSMIECLFLKKDISLQEKMKHYFKILVICLIISIICSLLEAFVNPLMIKIFLTITKIT